MDLIKSLNYTFFGLKERVNLEENIISFLNNIKKSGLSHYITYILSEAVTNGAKANLKKAYFEEKKIDPNDETLYEKYVAEFKKILDTDPKKLEDIAAVRGYFVKIEIYLDDDKIIFFVINNSPILEKEKKRIQDKYIAARRFKSVEDAMMNAYDASEGAGFGLIISLLMLRKIGLDDTNIKFFSDSTKTVFRLEIPKYVLTEEEKDFIVDSIKKEIELILQFPEHILRLQKILDDPTSDFKDVFVIIKQDPALVADLLRVVNSAAYGFSKELKSVEEAVKMIGFRGIKNLVLGYTTKNLLMSQYKIKEVKDIIDHSNEVAIIAGILVNRFNLKSVQEEFYLSSLLHDIGKIIVFAVDPSLFSKIKNFAKSRNLNEDIIDNIVLGYNHAIIGQILTEKWNFPKFVQEAVRYHHIPTEASEKYLDLVFVVYFSNVIFYYKRGLYKFEDINIQVLKKFKILNKEQMDEIVNYVYSNLKK
ncbi:MAG TPA: HDOD domain-containing protein [Spirochaetota bacterium]|nr:HDOD domain-containing protein [Spirochaetota bacterium]HOM38684.1 HDOD domain-containing protein [Spirochaetota bacterium]